MSPTWPTNLNGRGMATRQAAGTTASLTTTFLGLPRAVADVNVTEPVYTPTWRPVALPPMLTVAGIVPPLAGAVIQVLDTWDVHGSGVPPASTTTCCCCVAVSLTTTAKLSSGGVTVKTGGRTEARRRAPAYT